MSHSTKSYTKNLSSRYLRLPVIDNFFKIAESSIFKKNQSNKCNSHPQLEKKQRVQTTCKQAKGERRIYTVQANLERTKIMHGFGFSQKSKYGTFEWDFVTYIWVRVHFYVSGDVLILQLGGNIRQKQLTFLSSWWCNGLDMENKEVQTFREEHPSSSTKF